MLQQQPFGLQKKLKREKANWGRKKSNGGKAEVKVISLARDINRLERERRGEAGGKRKRKIKELNDKYRMKKKGINLVMEELRQRLNEKERKVKRYEQRIP